LEDIIVSLTDDISKKFLITDSEGLKKFITSGLSQLKNQIYDQILAQDGKNINQAQTLSKEEIDKILEELSSVKELNQKVQLDYKKLSEQYDKIAQQSVPNFEDIKKKIVQEIVAQEKEKHEKQIVMILKDLQNRVDKV
jgi:hypothetical protein